jgi:hypothetical protein
MLSTDWEVLRKNKFDRQRNEFDDIITKFFWFMGKRQGQAYFNYNLSQPKYHPLLFDYRQKNFYNVILSPSQGKIINIIRPKDFRRKFLICTETRVVFHIIRSIYIKLSLIVRCYCVIRSDTISSMFVICFVP